MAAGDAQERHVRPRLDGRARTAGILALSVLSALLGAGPAQAVPLTCGLAAHRGDHLTYTENSLKAMRQAIADGADYLELDIRPDADGTLFLMHNATVDATTDGTGPIAEMTDEQVRALRLDDGESVPTLSRIYRMAKPSSVQVLTEMKAMAGRHSYRRLARKIHRFGERRVRVTSFHRPLLDRLHRTDPDLAQGLITRRPVTPTTVAPYRAVLVKFSAITSAWLQQMPYPVFAWTVDDPSVWKGLANQVRAIITNEPVQFQDYRATACAG